MSEPILKAIDDNRGMSDIGSAIFVKRAGETKYHLWLAVSDMPATGSAPETIEKTVTTSRTKNYIFGRKDNAQKEFTFMAHRDNFMTLRQDYNNELDFLQVNPDGTGWKFKGFVSFYQDAVSLGAALNGKAVITVSQGDELPIDDVTDIIQESIIFTNAIPEIVKLSGTGTETLVIETDPSDATVAVASSATGVATASVSTKTITITGVASGSAIITITATKNGLHSGVTHILVLVS
jgi:hypothetical protein